MNRTSLTHLYISYNFSWIVFLSPFYRLNPFIWINGSSQICIIYLLVWRICVFIFYSQELQELRTNGVRSFRDIVVDESNILYWQGIIVPVSRRFQLNIFHEFLIILNLNGKGMVGDCQHLCYFNTVRTHCKHPLLALKIVLSRDFSMLSCSYKILNPTQNDKIKPNIVKLASLA